MKDIIKWEYKTISTDWELTLNELGEEGWELVCYSEPNLIFKRPVHTQKKDEDIIKSIIHSLDACECEWDVDLSEEKKWIKNRTLNTKD